MRPRPRLILLQNSTVYRQCVVVYTIRHSYEPSEERQEPEALEERLSAAQSREQKFTFAKPGSWVGTANKVRIYQYEACLDDLTQ